MQHTTLSVQFLFYACSQRCDIMSSRITLENFGSCLCVYWLKFLVRQMHLYHHQCCVFGSRICNSKTNFESARCIRWEAPPVVYSTIHWAPSMHFQTVLSVIAWPNIPPNNDRISKTVFTLLPRTINMCEQFHFGWVTHKLPQHLCVLHITSHHWARTHLH